MKRNHFTALFFGLALVAAVVGCQKDSTKLPYKGEQLNLPETAYNYANPTVPTHFQNVVNSPAFNVTDDGATLGRVLFYDTKLSLNNKTACGSCHLQANAFADPVKGSVGFDGQTTPRNSLAINNVAIEPELFWDLRENKLEEMVLKPIKNHVEMGMEDLDKLTGKLAGADYYPALFEKAFGTTDITKERISSAITQFLRSMMTTSAKIDMAPQGAALSAKEQAGMAVFFGKGLCYQCHGGRNLNEAFVGLNDTIPSFYSNRRMANIGLDEAYADGGMGEIDPAMEGIFKVPSLRNVGLTAPYMHDGRFNSLEEVVEHYNSNIVNHPNLDSRLRDWEGNPWRLQLTDGEKSDLVAFLRSFTDSQYTSDERFSNPFGE